MSFPLSTKNLARASALHPWRTVIIWLIVLVAAVVITGQYLADGLTTEFSVTNNPAITFDRGTAACLMEKIKLRMVAGV